MTYPPKVWNGVLRRLGSCAPEFSVAAWLAPLMPSWHPAPSAGGVELRLGCPSAFHRDRVRDRWLDRIHAAARDEVGKDVSVSLVVVEPAAPGPALPTSVEPPAPPNARTASATPHAEPAPPRASRSANRESADETAPAPAEVQFQLPHTFDTFVVGPCNALAREAALAAVRRPTRSLSPLYLAAASGMGKTHLARAMVHALGEQGVARPRVVYTSAEAFTNAFMTSIRSQRMERFKRRFREPCDLLVVENVQFLEGKAATQLEFFHTVEHVLDTGGRVVLSGDRLPHELERFDGRARSKLASGFVAEIEPPDAVVRRSILRARAAAGGFRLPDECLDLLVDEVRGSVRDLESALIQLVTTASLLGRPADIALTRDALAKKSGPGIARPRRLELGAIVKVVAAFHKLRPDQLATRSRRRDVLVPRQLAMYLCRRYTDASLTEIGRALGRDHASVRNAIARVERAMLEKAPLRYRVEALVERLDEMAEKNRRQ